MIKSYSKINLSLRVLSKLNNGLHNIETNTFLINLYDTIHIKKIKKKKDIIIFKGPFKKLVNRHKNSVSRTFSILRQKKLIDKNFKYRVIINKKIPVFSGLGGGTSNSAFILKYFTKKKLNKSIFDIFERKIGSDLSLFNYKQSHQKSLKKICKYRKKFNFYFMIVYPYFKCSTKEIYSKIKKYRLPSKYNFENITSEKKFINLIISEKNDLQQISTLKFPKLKKIIDFISTQKGCSFSRMTGSGSICFGMFKSRKLALLGMRLFKKKFPKYWCVVTKTI